MALDAPRIRQTAQNTQFTYELRCRSYDIKTYPILSPQGATILLYGHENGVTIVWRGGRRLKTVKAAVLTAASQAKSKPSSDNGVMILDSDDDEPASKPVIKQPFIDSPEFEDEYFSDSYPEITQTLDLTLGMAVTHIAVLPLTSTQPSSDGFFTGIEILASHMVFTVACANNDVHLITLPLIPPSNESKARPELREGPLADRIGAGLWGESFALLQGQMAPSTAVAMTLMKPKTGDKAKSMARIVVASHSSEAAGALRLWQRSLSDIKPSASLIDAFQTEYLSHDISSLAFNTTHTSQLMVVQPQQGIRVYDFTISPFPSEEVTLSPFPTQGSWLLSLFQPFTKGFPARKSIVDASWIAAGRAILVLLADGTWGVWDVDGVSPKVSSLLGKSGSGIIGGGVTTFTVSGQIEGTNLLRAGALDGKGGARVGPAALTSSVYAPGKMAAVHGGISVSPIPGPLGSNNDESVTLWISSSEHVCVIPAILRFLDSQTRRLTGGGVNLFAGSTPSRMIKIQELNTGLLGEKCTAISAIPIHPDLEGNDDEPTALGLPIEVAVLGESRLVIIRASEEKTPANNSLVVRKRVGKRNYANALVIDRPDKPKMLYNLNPGKAGTIRASRITSAASAKKAIEGSSGNKEATDSGGSFPFMQTLTAAADEDEAATAQRDIEFEMLDIMEIDRQLDSLEDFRGSGRRRVMFDGGS